MHLRLAVLAPVLLATAVLASAGVGGCSRADEPPGPSGAYTPSPPAIPAMPATPAPTPAVTGTPLPTASAASTASPGSGASAAPAADGPALVWQDPARWRRRPPSNAMRVAEYSVPHSAPDTQDAECSVITFGAGQGGSLDDNVVRWVKQFGPMTAVPSRRKHVANGMTITRVELAGTFHPMQMQGMPAGPEGVPGSRLVGDIVEGPSGEWFFKLTGPDATVKAAAKEFDAMVDTAHPR